MIELCFSFQNCNTDRIQDQLTNERFLFDDETIPSSVSDIIHYRSRMSKAKLDLGSVTSR
jgi:hypothetical protein